MTLWDAKVMYEYLPEALLLTFPIDERQEQRPMQAPTQLERVGILFLNRGSFAAAAVILTCVVREAPKNSLAWYGIGNALLCLSRSRDTIPLLRLSFSCLLRSLEEDS